jgi:DNA-binding transcriptional LysR family regulator
VAVDSAPRGRLRVSLPVVFGQRHVVPLLPSFLAANPAVTLELRFSDAYVDLVEEGVELALRVGTPAASSAVARTLAETPRALVASPDYLARRGRPERPEQLAEHDTLAHTPRAEWRVDGARVPVEARVAVDHSEAALALALAGCGVAMLARWLVDADLAAGRLEVVLPGRALPRAPIRVVWPSGRLSPGAAAFVAHLEADFRARWPRLTG